MSINTYVTLKAAVASWLHRSDLTTQIADFIALAESDIRRDVRCRAMEQQATGSLSGATLAVPTRFLEARQVAIANLLYRYVTPQQFDSTATTYEFTILGENFNFQASSGSYVIDYWQSFAALSADADTNWLLTNAPEVYLWAAVAQGRMYIEGDPSQAQAMYQRSISLLNAAEKKARYAGPLQIRTDGVRV